MSWQPAKENAAAVTTAAPSIKVDGIFTKFPIGPWYCDNGRSDSLLLIWLIPCQEMSSCLGPLVTAESL
jgi:hypothetical protein